MHKGRDVRPISPRSARQPYVHAFISIAYRTGAAAKAAILCIALLALIAPQTASAGGDIPLDQIKEGMRGYGRTVFEGDTITRFPVEVRGVVPGAGMSGEPLILVELTGREVSKYGGVSMGMSGSPVYINNKLAGALSLTFPMTDHSLAGVTPIGVMRKAAKYDIEPEPRPGHESGRSPLPSPVRVGGREYRWIQHGGPQSPDATSPGVLYARPALAPVAVGGLSERAMKVMDRFFRNSGVDIRPIQKLKMKTAKTNGITGPGSELKPGSSVAVQLVRGDIDFSAVGTITSVEDGQALMFGHPFFRKGPVEYLMADAYVNAIVVSSDVPYKITTTGLLRGKIVQDRGSALVGRLDTYPLLVPLKVNVTDADIGRERTVAVKIVRDREFIINLVLMVVLESIDNSIDRIGRGTAQVRFNLRASGHDDEIEMENMYYDRYDIAMRSLTDLIEALLLFSENRFFESMVTGLEIDLEIDSSNSVASIEKVDIAERIENPADAAMRKAAQQQAESIAAAAGGDKEGKDNTDGAAGETEAAGAGDEPGSATDETDTEDTGEVEKAEPEKIEEKTIEENEFAAFLDNIFEDEATGDDDKKGRDKKEELPRVMRGEKLKLNVRLRPYKEETIDENLFLKVPYNMALGNAVIKVFSGKTEEVVSGPGAFYLDISVEGPVEREQAEDRTYGEEETEESFEDILEDFLDRDLNNELVATIMPLGFKTEEDMTEDEKIENYQMDDGKAKKRTEWVLNGSAALKVKVVDEEGRSYKEIRIRKSKIDALRVE